jgi:hypothetical protein
MTQHRRHRRSAAVRELALAGCLALGLAGPLRAADIGQIKVSRGQVSVDRGGVAIPAAVGLRLQAADTVRTGADGAVGITMNDDSLLSAGPNSVLSLDIFALDPGTSQGRIATTLNRGTLAVVSGRIARQTPEAMTVRTPSAVIGVRGTEFVVAVDD